MQLKHILLDVDFFDKPKVRALSFRHKKTASGWLIQSYMQMSRASNALVTRDTLESLAFEWGIEDIETVLSYCIEHGLITQHGDQYSNERVEKDQEKYAVKLENSADRVARFREKKEEKCNALQTRTSDTDTVIVSSLLSPSLVLEGVPGETQAGEKVEFPEAQTVAETRAHAAIERWGEYMTKTLKKPWSQLQADSLMMRYHGRADQLTRDIAQAMASGWRSVRDLSGENEKNNNFSPRAILSQHEKNMLVLKKFADDDENGGKNE